MKNRWILFVMVFLFSGQVQKAKGTDFSEGLFRYADFGRPLWADMHSSITRGEVAWAINSDEYNYGNNDALYRPYVFANIGVDLPLWTGHFKDGKFGLTATLPFFVDVWMDFFERSTAPVINTAYRFGMPEFSFIHRLDKPWFGIRNYGLKLTPMKHECTHIGDELTIYRKNNHYEITRVNVSYNYGEIGFTINDPDGSLKRNHCFRFSYLFLLDRKAGWYNIIPAEGDTTKVKPSKMPREWYFQYQFQTNTHPKSHLQGIFSIEWRNRVRYGYPFFYSKAGEDPILEDEIGSLPVELENEYRWTNVNAMIGVRYNNPKLNGYRVGLALRAYNGINPYGQFRSMPIFHQYGICLLFEH